MPTDPTKFYFNQSCRVVFTPEIYRKGSLKQSLKYARKLYIQNTSSQPAVNDLNDLMTIIHGEMMHIQNRDPLLLMSRVRAMCFIFHAIGRA